jgi:regulator of sigma E protease
MEILKTIGLILLSLSLLIVIHEFGHFWAARIFKIRVEKFYLFFDWKFKLFSIKRGDTEWGIGWLPLGGYVKIAGMLDESMDKEQLDAPVQPWEFRAKPTWQRLIVMLGGVIMNVVLGVLIFIGLKFFVGDLEVSHRGNHGGFWSETDGIWVHDSSFAYKMGFRTGDQLVSFDGDTMRSFSALVNPGNLLHDGSKFAIKRSGKDTVVSVAEGSLDRFQDEGGGALFLPDMKPLLYVADTTGMNMLVRAGEDTSKTTIQAWRAGLRTGDVVLKVDSTPVSKFSELNAYVRARAQQPITFTVSRAGKEIPPIVAVSKADGRLGLLPYTDTLLSRVKYSFGEAIPAGTATAFKVVTDNVKGLTSVATGKLDARKSLSGPVGIAKFMKRGFDVDGWEFFWRMTAMLSMVLAVMNLLPIPVLDGGQIVILLIEAVIGREIPRKVKEVILTIGFLMVIALMLFATLNDIFK